MSSYAGLKAEEHPGRFRPLQTSGKDARSSDQSAASSQIQSAVKDGALAELRWTFQTQHVHTNEGSHFFDFFIRKLLFTALARATAAFCTNQCTHVSQTSCYNLKYLADTCESHDKNVMQYKAV